MAEDRGGDRVQQVLSYLSVMVVMLWMSVALASQWCMEHDVDTIDDDVDQLEQGEQLIDVVRVDSRRANDELVVVDVSQAFFVARFDLPVIPGPYIDTAPRKPNRALPAVMILYLQDGEVTSYSIGTSPTDDRLKDRIPVPESKPTPQDSILWI